MQRSNTVRATHTHVSVHACMSVHSHAVSLTRTSGRTALTFQCTLACHSPYLQELIHYHGESFDIRLIQLIIALIVAPLGGLMCLLGFALMLWKLPVALVRAEWEVFLAYFKGKGSCFEACLLFVPWLIALAVTPAGVVLAGAMLPIGGLLFGFTMAGITSYQARTLLGEWGLQGALVGFPGVPDEYPLVRS